MWKPPFKKALIKLQGEKPDYSPNGIDRSVQLAFMDVVIPAAFRRPFVKMKGAFLFFLL